MGFFERLSKALHANLNELLSKAEDPEKLRELAIFELLESKKKAQKLLSRALAAKNLAERNFKASEEKVVKLLKEAEEMLSINKEESARLILEEKQKIDLEQAQSREEINLEQQTIDIIKKGIPALEQKIGELQHPSINEKAFDESPFDTFSRMEQKIEHNEAEVTALKELCDQEEAKTKSPSPKNVSKPSLEEELEALRQKMKDR